MSGRGIVGKTNKKEDVPTLGDHSSTESYKVLTYIRRRTVMMLVQLTLLVIICQVTYYSLGSSNCLRLHVRSVFV